GGTHLHNTNEVGIIKLVKSTKIQDGIVRLEFVAGESGKKYIEKQKKIQKEVGRGLNVKAIQAIANVFSVEVDKVPQTIERFNKECGDKIKKLVKLEKQLGEKVKKFKLLAVKDRDSARELFNLWKELDKIIENLNKKLAAKIAKEIKNKSVKEVSFDMNTMRTLASRIDKVLLYNKQGEFVFKGTGAEFEKLKKFGAKGGGAEIKQGRLDVKKVKKFKF
ncbi:hypothetical protein KY312_03005, partial [Candidatus Woesearchaeota archaeon]|nr:hypothetical protein [Candidatus Woesearchaeota archaeon]